MKILRKIEVLLGLLMIIGTGHAQGQAIVINEFMASNGQTLADQDGDYPDWIELFNPTDQDVSLLNWSLTDVKDNPNLWIFPDVVIKAHSYLVVFASDKNRTDPGQELHTNFKLDKSGEYLALINANGQMSTAFDPAYPQQIRDISYANIEGSFLFINRPTPGAENVYQIANEVVQPPTFSEQAGFFAEPFLLTITHPDTAVTIVYTLDGSIPSLHNVDGRAFSYRNEYDEDPTAPKRLKYQKTYSHIYDGPVSIVDRSREKDKYTNISSTPDADPSYYFPKYPVRKGMVVRAMAVKEEAQDSEVITHTPIL